MKKVTKVVAAIMLMTAVACIAGCTKTEYPNNDGNGGNSDGGNNGGASGTSHTYVNLGLPSGTLWATCNLGAGMPEAYGYYFAWGETTSKSTYNWNTYEYCNGGYNQLTKYCNNSNYGYNGFTDNFTRLQTSDDAATVQWGSGWRTPTNNDWDELLAYCTHTWTTSNGVTGGLFTAPNGNSIFLPAAGGREGVNFEAAGVACGYWLSSIDTDYPYNAWYFLFRSEGYIMKTYNRYVGMPIRPVRSSK